MPLRPALALAAAAALAACTVARPGLAPGVDRSTVEFVAVAAPPAERLLVHRAELGLVAAEPAALARRVAEITEGSGGHVVASLVSEGRVLRATLRVPAGALEPTLDALSGLGRVSRREVSARDVTEQVFDVEARLRSLRAVRERLRQHLERAEGVRDLIEVERELTRVQGEIEMLEGRAGRLRGDAALAQVELVVRRETVLGPLGWLLHGVVTLISKLFVIR
jgi:hypothetical protein